MRRLSNDQAARVALGAQGITRPRPSGRVDVRHFRRTIGHMGVIQLDSVNVLVRSHYLPVFSRLGPYDRGALDRWAHGSGELFEYWGHAASLIPVVDYPLYRWRMAAVRPWPMIRRIDGERPGYIEEVYRQVADRGPVTVGDLDEAGERTGPWWGYAPGKVALEWLFATGRITAYRDGTFTRLYDVPERVIPEHILTTTPPSREEAHRRLLVRAVRHHGIGTAADLADYHRLKVPAAKRVLDRLASEGIVDRVEVEGWRAPAYFDREASIPHRRGTALLSPFDPLVWNRDRVERLFGFHYRIEIYTPAARRVHGYYVLPLLVDGHLAGRVDLKADRDAATLLVRGTFIEPDVDRVRVVRSLAGELHAMATWLDLREVVVERNGDAAAALSAVV